MKKVLLVIGIILLVIIITGIIFFCIDSNRVKNGELPMFCINNPAGTLMDGGTKEYIGLGYKVIKFNKLNGYKETKIGSWFMKYEDFEDEYNNYVFDPIYLVKAEEPEDKIKLNVEDSLDIQILLENINYDLEPDNSTFQYFFEFKDGTIYKLKTKTKTIEKNDGESQLSDDEFNMIKTIIDMYDKK